MEVLEEKGDGGALMEELLPSYMKGRWW